MAESRYGEQQKELLAALGEAELALREKDPSSASASSYPPFAESLHNRNTMSSLPLKSVLADPKQSTDHFFSDYVRQSTQVPTRPKVSESSRHDSQDLNQLPVHILRSDGAHLSNAELQVSAFTVAVKDGTENSHDEDKVQGREGYRGDDSNCGTCSSPPSTIIGEGDSVLGDINKALYTPSAHRYHLSRNTVSDRVLVSSTPSFLSTSYASPLGESLERSHYKPLGQGSGVYSEKVLAGDERHVSVALRAYAMSVAEEEKKSWHSPVNMKNYPHQTFSVSTLRGAGDPSSIRPVRMFTEDEIVSKSQSPDGA